MKQIFVLIIIISLFIYSVTDLLQKDCVEKKISFDTQLFEWICDYKNKAFLYVNRHNDFYVNEFLDFSNIDLEVWKYILKHLNKEKLWEVDKIQMYYILSDIYKYSDVEINEIVWKIDQNYKYLDTTLARIILAENLLTTDYTLDKNEFDDPTTDNLPLLHSDVKFLQIVFTLEPQRFDSINLASSLRSWYDVLDEKSKILYVQIMKNLLNKTNQEFSKGALTSFLDSIEK